MRSPNRPIAQEYFQEFNRRANSTSAAELVEPIRQQSLSLLQDPAELDRILTTGANRAREIASKVLARAQTHIGILERS